MKLDRNILTTVGGGSFLSEPPNLFYFYFFGVDQPTGSHDKREVSTYT